MADIALPNHGDPNWDSPLNAAIEAVNADVETRAPDATVVHKTGDEAIAGTKTFAVAPAVPDASFPIAKTAGLQAALDAAGGSGGIGALDKTNKRYAVDLEGNPYLAARPTGVTEGAMASGDRSIAIGLWTTEASGDYSLAVGEDAHASADGSIAIGGSAEAKTGPHSYDRNIVAIGQGAIGSNNAATAIGPGAQASGSLSVALGGAIASGDSAIAVGSDAVAGNTSATAVGDNSNAVEIGSVAVGQDSAAMSGSAIAIGNQNVAIYEAIAVGTEAYAQGQQSVAIGSEAKSYSTETVALGMGSAAYASHSVAILADDMFGTTLREQVKANVRDLHIVRRPRPQYDPTGPFPNDPHDDYARDSQTGVILHSPNGSAWRVAVDNSGALTASAVTLSTYPRWPRQRPSTLVCSSIATSNDGTKAVAVYLNGGGLYMTTDSGATWTAKAGAGAPSWGWAKVFMSSDGTKVVADNKKSIDSGATWSTITYPSSATQPSSMSAKPDLSAIVVIIGGKLYKSTDLGGTWTQLLTGFLNDFGESLDSYFKTVAISADGNTIVANIKQYSNLNGKFYISSNGGTTWAVGKEIGKGYADNPAFMAGASGSAIRWIDAYGNVVIGDPAVLVGGWNSAGGVASYGPMGYVNSISASSNGYNWVAVEGGAGIHIAKDGGMPQYVQASAGNGFYCCAVSGNGARVYAATNQGYIYTSAIPLAAA